MRPGAAIAALTVLIGACAINAPGERSASGPARPADSFAALDVNNDGMLHRSETAFVPGMTARFDAVDADGDGALTRGELASCAPSSARACGPVP